MCTSRYRVYEGKEPAAAPLLLFSLVRGIMERAFSLNVFVAFDREVRHFHREIMRGWRKRFLHDGLRNTPKALSLWRVSAVFIIQPLDLAAAPPEWWEQRLGRNGGVLCIVQMRFIGLNTMSPPVARSTFNGRWIRRCLLARSSNKRARILLRRVASRQM